MTPAAEARAEPALVAAAAVPAVAPAGHVCLDCGAPLTGKYCSVCGQKHEPLKRNLGDLALEFIQHPLIDTKLWRSLVPLLLRPGVLTVEYLAGRRTRYIRPLKLYLTISVTFFACLALFVPRDSYIHIEPDAPKAKATPAAGAAETRAQRGTVHLPIHWLDERLQRNFARLDAAEDGGLRNAVANRIAGLLPKLVFVLLPLSAFLLKLFWWKRYYVEHLVFSLHLHSFAFAAGTVLLVQWVPVAVVVTAWGVAYGALAFKRVYGNGWVKTLAKLWGLWFCYVICLAMALAVAMLGVLVVS